MAILRPFTPPLLHERSFPTDGPDYESTTVRETSPHTAPLLASSAPRSSANHPKPPELTLPPSTFSNPFKTSKTRLVICSLSNPALAAYHRFPPIAIRCAGTTDGRTTEVAERAMARNVGAAARNIVSVVCGGDGMKRNEGDPIESVALCSSPPSHLALRASMGFPRWQAGALINSGTSDRDETWPRFLGFFISIVAWIRGFIATYQHTMKHGIKLRKLGRTSSHRSALLRYVSGSC